MNQKTYAIFPSKRPKAERALPLEQRLAYSIQEAADLLGVAYTTLWRAVQRGELHPMKTAGILRISRKELERFLDSQLDLDQEPTQEQAAV